MQLESHPLKRTPLSPVPSSSSESTVPSRLIRPIGAYALHGLAFKQGDLFALDVIRGYLLQIDPTTDNTIILNTRHSEQYQDATGLAIWGDGIWFARGHEIYTCSFQEFAPIPFTTLPYDVDGVAVWESTVYAASKKAGYIFILDRDTGRRITKFPLPGIGMENIAVDGERLWLCDQLEQTVYCLDRATGALLFSVLTPFASPTGIAVHPNTSMESDTVWLAYAYEEPYIRDDPNSDDPHQLTFRDRTFIHPLHFHYDAEKGYALSNGYLLEMSYVEEISPLDALQLHQLEWRIALPTDTQRQTVKHIEPIGRPFTEELMDGQRIALFKFDTLNPHETHIFGWKAQLEVRGIKYQLTPRRVEDAPPLSPEFQQRYLVDDDQLAMDAPNIQAAAQQAVGSETNLLRQVLSIRNYVYDRLSYGIRPQIDTPDVVLERGVGSCGEYVGLLLAFCRLNGIACRTVGRYKCPPRADQIGVLLEPDFNHVWLEFYIPGYGWLPMESNVDDVMEGGPYPTRFFMGLPWYHVEMAKGVPFERIKKAEQDLEVKIGELAINHVRFKILAELPPVGRNQAESDATA